MRWVQRCGIKSDSPTDAPTSAGVCWHDGHTSYARVRSPSLMRLRSPAPQPGGCDLSSGNSPTPRPNNAGYSPTGYPDNRPGPSSEKEHIIPAVPPVSDMMRTSRYHYSSKTWHRLNPSGNSIAYLIKILYRAPASEKQGGDYKAARLFAGGV